MDDDIKERVKRIPLLTVKAGPRDGEEWARRLKEEYKALIAYVKMNKDSDTDWFKIEVGSNSLSSFAAFSFLSSHGDS